ncbi:hypothetical protein Tco_0220100, partial [Tanacetum coccineum]
TIKNHKRQHDDDDDDDDDDDEDPLAGPNQVKELIAKVAMDDVVNTAGEDVVRNDDQPQDNSEPKTYKTPNEDWFKQPPRHPTPDSEWNKRQVVLDQPE